MMMRSNLKQLVHALLCACFVLSALPARAVENGGYAHPESLIYAAELKKLIDEKAVKVVDIRSVEDYETGHIPGAIQITRTAFENPDGEIEALVSTPQQMDRLLSDKGITNDDALVVYSGARSPQMATRFWWAMKVVYGHANVRVLDGNFENWSAGGHPVETGPMSPLPKSAYKTSPADEKQIVDRKAVAERAPEVVLLDVRDDEEYSGSKVSNGAGRGGRIPGAVHVFFRDALDEKGFFKPAAELKALYEAQGVTPDKQIIVYCMRAHRASHTLFVLKELLGYSNLRVYDGSWIDWSNVPDLPIERDHFGTVTYEISLTGAEKAERAEIWLPYPLSDAFQSISKANISGNAESMGVENDPRGGAVYLRASWAKPQATPVLTLRFDIHSSYRKLKNLRETDTPFPVEVLRFLEDSDSLAVSDPLFADVAEKLKKEPSILKRARMAYDWVVENTFRNNDVKGCGLGLPVRTLTEMKGGGKCADISAVFVALLRAAGVPARDVYGLRMASPKNGEITGDFHCWAEFYVPGIGWVPADPADVRKAMLTDGVELQDAGTLKEFFWVGDELFRIALNRDTRGTILSDTTKKTPLTYFMYPYAEVDGKPKDYFTPKDFTYKVTLDLK